MVLITQQHTHVQSFLFFCLVDFKCTNTELAKIQSLRNCRIMSKHLTQKSLEVLALLETKPWYRERHPAKKAG